MFQEKKNSNFLQKSGRGMNAKASRCGWVCKTLRKVGDALNSVGLGSIGGPLKVAADVISFAETILAPADNTLTQGGGWDDNMRRADFLIIDAELTANEELILDGWEVNQLTPYIKLLATEIENAFNQSSFENKALGINSVLTKMAVIIDHYKLNDKNGLSQNAVLIRSQLISELFKPLYDMAEIEMSGSGYNKIVANYSVSALVPTYAPLFTATNLTTISAVQYSKEIQNPILVKPLPVVKPVIPNVLPPGVGTTTNTKKEKNFLQKNGVWLAIAGVAIWAFSPDKKKSKKVNN